MLHEEAVFPVRREGIPIQIRNTNDPADPGTIIRRQLSAEEEVPITGIAGKKEFAAISIAKNCMNSEIGFIKKLLEAFEENKISFEHLPSGIDTVSVILPRVEYEEKKDAIMASLRRLARSGQDRGGHRSCTCDRGRQRDALRQRYRGDLLYLPWRGTCKY